MPKVQLAAARRDGFATVNEGMSFLSVGRTKFYAMLTNGELPSITIRKSRRIPWAALHKLVEDAMSSADPFQEGGDSNGN